jgi:plasmid stabilization system protein ParE
MTVWEIHPSAEEELEEVADYYLGIDAELAQSFDQHYRHYRQLICEMPLLYNLRLRGTRRVNLLPRFGEYYIAYMIWLEKVVILAVAHAKRRPYYWRDRITQAKELFNS